MAEAGDIILEVADLEKSFDSVIAAHEINLSFNRYENVGIIGANGAGKTTFVNMVTGYLKPTSGTIRYLDRDITGMSPRNVTRSGLCRSFQIPQLFPTMSVYENILIAIGIAEASWLPVFNRLNTTKRSAEADEILENYGIFGYRDQEVALLPQGIRKLVDVAMATARKPDLLMLDEPTSGISAEEKYGLMDIIMEALQRQQVTVLFIEHDMDIVSRYASRVLAFYNGTVIADGPPAEVLDDDRVKEYVSGTHLGQRRKAGRGRAASRTRKTKGAR